MAEKTEGWERRMEEEAAARLEDLVIDEIRCALGTIAAEAEKDGSWGRYEMVFYRHDYDMPELARAARNVDAKVAALAHQHQEGTGVGEAGCERCEHYRRALSRVNGHIGISPTCGGSQSGVTLYGAEGITPDEAEQVGGLMQEAFARSAKPPCGTCEGTGQLTPPEGVGPLLPCPTCTTEKQGEAERPRKYADIEAEILADPEHRADIEREQAELRGRQ